MSASKSHLNGKWFCKLLLHKWRVHHGILPVRSLIEILCILRNRGFDRVGLTSRARQSGEPTPLISPFYSINDQSLADISSRDEWLDNLVSNQWLIHEELYYAQPPHMLGEMLPHNADAVWRGICNTLNAKRIILNQVSSCNIILDRCSKKGMWLETGAIACR